MLQVIGKRVTAVREARGLSQTQLAANAGLTRSQISRVEKDQQPGVLAVAVGQLAAALHTTSDYLLGLTDDPTPPLPVDWRADPERLVRVHRLVERVVRLPRERQERIMDAMLTLLELGDVANEQDIEAADLRRGASPPDPDAD